VYWNSASILICSFKGADGISSQASLFQGYAQDILRQGDLICCINNSMNMTQEMHSILFG